MFCSGCEIKNEIVKNRIALITIDDTFKSYVWCKYCETNNLINTKETPKCHRFYRKFLDEKESEEILKGNTFFLSKKCPNFVDNMIYDNIEERVEK